jgi:hypothetical protein
MGVSRQVGCAWPGPCGGGEGRDGTIKRALDFHVQQLLSYTRLGVVHILVEKNLGAHFQLCEAWYTGNKRVRLLGCCPTATSGIHITRGLKAIVFSMLKAAIVNQKLRVADTLFSAHTRAQDLHPLFSKILKQQRWAAEQGAPRFVPRVVGDDPVVAAAIAVWYIEACEFNPYVSVLRAQQGIVSPCMQPGIVSCTPQTRKCARYLIALAKTLRSPLEIYVFCKQFEGKRVHKST